ncbi:hypothetical protein J6590_095898 [Homalodisca vitripennis]|nr:hypothetical protein J6590_095898 [Homalodisca vitripennis]
MEWHTIGVKEPFTALALLQPEYGPDTRNDLRNHGEIGNTWRRPWPSHGALLAAIPTLAGTCRNVTRSHCDYIRGPDTSRTVKLIVKIVSAAYRMSTFPEVKLERLEFRDADVVSQSLLELGEERLKFLRVSTKPTLTTRWLPMAADIRWTSAVVIDPWPMFGWAPARGSDGRVKRASCLPFKDRGAYPHPATCLTVDPSPDCYATEGFDLVKPVVEKSRVSTKGSFFQTHMALILFECVTENLLKMTVNLYHSILAKSKHSYLL